MISETTFFIPGFLEDAESIDGWVKDALGLEITSSSRPSDGRIRIIGDLTTAQTSAIGALLQQHDKAVISAPTEFDANGIATVTATLTVSDQASGSFDLLVYLAGDKENGITESVSLKSNTGTLTIGPALVVGDYIIERSDNNYFARARVGAI